STLIRFMGTGVEHILFGWDHLIFLSTLLVSGRGLRQLLILLTAFIIAHSVTFFLAANGLVRFHPDLVELAIAGTIILSALKNILAIPIPAAVFALLVFSCGLIHGLGFASSMNTIGLVGPRMVATLLGFNLGVEIGQVFLSSFGFCVHAFIIALEVLILMVAHPAYLAGFSYVPGYSGSMKEP
ncbi:MAG: HupE/UreJ family protein, partial [Methylococcaceae bacterium]